MTRMRTASIGPPEESRRSNSATSRHATLRQSKLPPNAPELIVRNTINLPDPVYWLPLNKSDRSRNFTLLVRRYKHQILYGCQDPNCRTPTCLSYQKRVAEGPFRRYTELSARTLACYLASSDDPESGLCRNPPQAAYDFSSADSAHQPPKRRSAYTSASPAPDTIPPTTIKVTGPDIAEYHDQPSNSDAIPSKGATASLTHSGEVSELPSPPPRKTKDPKSFTQNLFDTLALRMIEWLPFRGSHMTYQDRVEPMTAGDSSGHKWEISELDATRSTLQNRTSTMTRQERTIREEKTESTAYSASTSPHVPPQYPSVEVRSPVSASTNGISGDGEPHRLSSRPGVDEKARPEDSAHQRKALNTPSHTNGSIPIPSPPALKHRPQKHASMGKDMNGTYFKGSKKHRRVSWDGSKLFRECEPPKDDEAEVTIQELPTAAPTPTMRPPRRARKERTMSQVSVSVQTLSHLSSDIVEELRQMMFERAEDAEAWKEELAMMEASGRLYKPQWRYATLRQQEIFPFLAQSVFYALGNTQQLLRSMQIEHPLSKGENGRDGNTRSDISNLDKSLRTLLDLCPWFLVSQSLWKALDSLFIPPSELSNYTRTSRLTAKGSTSPMPSPSLLPHSRTSDTHSSQFLSDTEAAHIATVAFFALACSLPSCDLQTWRGILQMRSAGTVLPDAEMRKLKSATAGLVVEITDRLEHDMSLRLVSRLVRGLIARLAFYEITKMRSDSIHESKKNRKPNVLDIVLENLAMDYSLRDEIRSTAIDTLSQQPTTSFFVVEWVRTLFLKEWDGKPEMASSSAAGGAIRILSSIYKERRRLGLDPEDFHTPFLSDRLDPMDMPVEWLGRQSSNKTLHLLSYPFLFPPSALVIYFRSLNYMAMSKSFEAAMTATRHVTQTALSNSVPVYDDFNLLARLRTSMATYFVLVVRRDNALTDALNQLWRRERRELMRPLKVQMGMDEGEEGIDHGGVQQEFFRVVFGEALDPSYGMFTMDLRSHVSWFQPCALEPLYKFELLGLLMSLAVYNGLTLPVNFPVAFYRKLLGLKVKQLDHIRDGWPELTKGLEELLRWSDGDVGDIFMRTYEFSFENFGKVTTVDMEHTPRDAIWPVPERVPSRERARSSASDFSVSRGDSTRLGSHRRRLSKLLEDGELKTSGPNESFRTGILKGFEYNASLETLSTQGPEEASLVTNENREQFVKDYIFWLTDKSIRNQYEAFARGFYTCLDRTSLSIFTPEALKTVVEGIEEINVDELEKHARYEGGFNSKHPLICDFWNIVKHYPPERKSQLLEFVTASDRVPVNGVSSIMFVIQKNGTGDGRLPTSLTCFGRLLLPEYSSREVMEEKLNKALDNARGFGVA